MEKRTKLAVALAETVGEFVAEQFRAGIGVERKEDGTTVTEADREAELRIRDGIRSAFPEDAIVGEEHENEEGVSGMTWYIDPIDGTSNFANSIPLYAVSIAYADAEGVLGCAIALPSLGSIYHAERNSGAWKNKERLSISKTWGAQRPFLLAAFAGGDDRRISALYGLSPRPRIRILGSVVAMLALYAEGAGEGVIMLDMKPWDYAAGALLVAEAGADVGDISGDPIQLPQVASIFAVAPEYREQMRTLLDKLL